MSILDCLHEPRCSRGPRTWTRDRMNPNGAPAAIRRVIMGTDWRTKILPPVRFPINKDIEASLATPTWSVSSLLPKDNSNAREEVTTKDLLHLMRLSALPAPEGPEDQQQMLQTLQSQIHFVKEVQKVDTTGVEPLVVIRDETEAAEEEETITVEKLKPWLDQEVKVGTNGTIRRKKPQEPPKPPDWDPFGLGGFGREKRRMGKFFFVRKLKEELPTG